MGTVEFIVRYSLVMAGIYIIWRITGYRRTDPVYDRFFMIMAPLAALLVTFMDFEILHFRSELADLRQIPEIQTTLSILNGEKTNVLTPEHSAPGILQICRWIFTGISFLFAFNLFRSIIIKLKLIRKYEIKQSNNMKIIPVDKKILPFSFMRYIFLNPSEYDPMSLKAIIEHEKAHIHGLHFIDIIFYELLKTVLWFHPVYWLMRKKLVESHEYLADRKTLESGVERTDYMILILSHLKNPSIAGIGNNFSKMITVKRLQMMKTNYKSKPAARILISLTGIAVITLLFSFTLSGPEVVLPKAEGPEVTSIAGNPPNIAPVDLGKVKFTSGFGMRMHPVKKVKMMHKGLDLAAPLGTDVVSTAAGEVIETGFSEGAAGNYIKIKHDDVYETFYSQLDKILVKTGDEVKAGQLIGKVGSSGMSTGPHLHYEVHKNGEAVDPKDYLPSN